MGERACLAHGQMNSRCRAIRRGREKTHKSTHYEEGREGKKQKLMRNKRGEERFVKLAAMKKLWDVEKSVRVGKPEVRA